MPETQERSIRRQPLVDQVDFWATRVIQANTEREGYVAGRELAKLSAALTQRVREMARGQS